MHVWAGTSVMQPQERQGGCSAWFCFACVFPQQPGREFISKNLVSVKEGQLRLKLLKPNFKPKRLVLCFPGFMSVWH